jgi:hypothetical protein
MLPLDGGGLSVAAGGHTCLARWAWPSGQVGLPVSALLGWCSAGRAIEACLNGAV